MSEAGIAWLRGRSAVDDASRLAVHRRAGALN
jgi:hypothetical protein